MRVVLLLLVIVSVAFYLQVENLLPVEKSIFKLAHAKTLPQLEADVFDYTDTNTVSEKKERFFDILRPIVINQNQIIRDRRHRIIQAIKNNSEQEWLKNITEKYRLEWDDNAPDWQELLSRVDTLPVDLVLTQAANESAWGKSRFAQQANNLFGQWCFSKNCGLVPEKRSKGQRHEVKAFESINDSVESYLHNVNTGRAYKSLRQLRYEMRRNNKPLDAFVLATGLNSYSSRGQAYVNELQAMIRSNRELMFGLN